jgi:hypothetical protein
LKRPKPGQKTDRKILLFGEKEGALEESGSNLSAKEETHFIAVIQRTLREALEGLLITAEVLIKKNYAWKVLGLDLLNKWKCRGRI